MNKLELALPFREDYDSEELFIFAYGRAIEANNKALARAVDTLPLANEPYTRKYSPRKHDSIHDFLAKNPHLIAKFRGDFF